jgi:hypothetical protein
VDFVERLVATAPALCAGLVDQGRFVGGDPVGHACPRAAEAWFWRDGFCWAVCAACLASLRADEGRVTLFPWRAWTGTENGGR